MTRSSGVTDPASCGSDCSKDTMRTPVKGSGCVIIESFHPSHENTIHQREATDPGEDTNKDYFKASVTTLRNSYPLKLMVPSKASNNNCVWVYPITFGGGLVGGDGIAMDFHAKNNCALLITGQESTKVYPCEENLHTNQTLRGKVDKGGLLCVLSDPVVCFKNSHFSQIQEFRMSSEGNLVYLDWLIGGRVALGELWQLRSYHNKTDVFVDNVLVYRDNYHLCERGLVPIKQAMRHMQVLGSCIILGNKVKSIATNLHNLFGRKHDIGEKFDADLLCSVSPLKYPTGTSFITGVYIKFMAATSAKAYHGVVAHIVKELESVIGGNPFEDKY